MTIGRKTGGRSKGTPNKDKATLKERLDRAYPGYDPILALANMANDDSLDPSMRLDCHKIIASYIHPKMRPIEHHPDDETEPAPVILIKVREPIGPIRITRGSDSNTAIEN